MWTVAPGWKNIVSFVVNVVVIFCDGASVPVQVHVINALGIVILGGRLRRTITGEGPKVDGAATARRRRWYQVPCCLVVGVQCACSVVVLSR